MQNYIQSRLNHVWWRWCFRDFVVSDILLSVRWPLELLRFSFTTLNRGAPCSVSKFACSKQIDRTFVEWFERLWYFLLTIISKAIKTAMRSLLGYVVYKSESRATCINTYIFSYKRFLTVNFKTLSQNRQSLFCSCNSPFFPGWWTSIVE